MILVDQPYFHPGRCIVLGTGGPESGPYVDLQTEDDLGNRRYISLDAVNQLTSFVGGATSHERQALEEIAESREELLEAIEELQRRYDALEAAVAMTLAVGAVFDKRTMKPRLRKVKSTEKLVKAEDATNGHGPAEDEVDEEA